eukprot:s7287_g3.t1
MTSLPLKLSLWQSCATWQSAWPLAVSLTTSSDKENPFGSIAKVLGLKINLEDARLGKIYMCNTESRQQELFESLSAVLEKSFLSRKDGERLRGRMQFAEAQIAGKAAGLAAKLASSGTAQEPLFFIGAVRSDLGMEPVTGAERPAVERCAAAHPLQALSSRLRLATEMPSWASYLPKELHDKISAAGQPGQSRAFGIVFQSIIKDKASQMGSERSDAWWFRRLWTLSRDSKGCREVQKALDEASGEEERLAMALELRGHVWEALRCPFGNYVLQKCIQVLSRENLFFIFEELKQKGPEMIQQAARHKYGCRIIQRLLECGPADEVNALIDTLLVDAISICAHPFGNYVIQNMLDQSTREQRRRLLYSLIENVALVGNDSDNVYISAVMVKIMTVAQRDE